MELRPYQLEARDAIMNEWKEHKRTLAVLPTGTGKTVLFSSIAEQKEKEGRVLILAHREELLTQASDKLYKLTGLHTSLEKADSSCLDAPEHITVGSVQTLQTEKRLSRFNPDYFGTIIVDEAHHAVADGYQRVLNYFDNANVLGVTATPDRGDMKNLGQYFESLAYEYSLRDAVKQGYLCPIKVQTMPLSIDISEAKVSRGDYQLGDVGHALEPYLVDIAREMAKVCKGRKTVVFLPLVEIAQKMRDILNTVGFKAAEVNGESKDRAEVLEAFDKGEYDVICNAMLLTEGWDCPSVDTVVVLRPTKVRSLYCQMIGRGTRLHPGKDHLLVLDFLWMTGKHDLVHPADIICQNKEIADRVTAELEKSDEPLDLFVQEEEQERNAKEERKNALAQALRDSANARKKSKTVDPLEYMYSIDMGDILAGYVPTFGWESEDITEKQAKTLTGFGFDVTGLTKGSASKILDRCMKRIDAHMATPKQVKLLARYGFTQLGLWTFEDANTLISQLQAAHWQPYRCGIEPAFYVPKSLREDGNMHSIGR